VIEACAEISSWSSLSSAEQRMQRTGLVIPTHNAARYWPRLRAALDVQGFDCSQILVVDSSSTDGTDRFAEQAGYRVVRIPKSTFRHGATRQMATTKMGWADFLVFVTQDAVPCGQNAILNLVAAFDNPNIGAAYGRQLPRAEADAIEAHARIFNYPGHSEMRDFASRETLGFRATFFSNSFAAYRRAALQEVGGFPDVIVSEEVTTVARMLIAGWSIAYKANAQVTHSHPISVADEFSRYFDIAVHHSREEWILESFGRVGGEGMQFVASELQHLRTHAPHLIPFAMLKNVAKWVGYQIGLREKYLPREFKLALSSQANFWAEAEETTPPENSVASSTTKSSTLSLLSRQPGSRRNI
jgi:rhamnosyltransferase